MKNFRVWDLWAEPLPHGETVDECRKAFWKLYKRLGVPAFRIPGEEMTARRLDGICRQCGRCKDWKAPPA